MLGKWSHHQDSTNPILTPEKHKNYLWRSLLFKKQFRT